MGRWARFRPIGRPVDGSLGRRERCGKRREDFAEAGSNHLGLRADVELRGAEIGVNAGSALNGDRSVTAYGQPCDACRAQVIESDGPAGCISDEQRLPRDPRRAQVLGNPSVIRVFRT